MKRMLGILTIALWPLLAFGLMQFPVVSTIKAVPAGSMDNWQGSHMNGSVRRHRDPRYRTNILKNRYIAPASAPGVQFEDLLQAKTGSHAFNQTKGASLEGWIGKVIREGDESCNDYHGNLPEDSYVDEHIYLFASLDEYRAFINPGLRTGKKDRVINIETTPRTKELAKRAGFDWTKESLDRLVGHHVRITGWLLNDWEHAKQSKVDGAINPIHRGTCWEIHPITKIELLD